MKSFSIFQSVEPASLREGQILGEPGSMMKFPNGIAAETCFTVALPPAEAARRLQFWDPSLRGTLKTIQFHPVSYACTAADFQNLSLHAENRAQRWLLDKTTLTLDRKSDLNLTRAEARQLSDSVKGHMDPQNVSAAWAKILLGRAVVFQRQGFLGIAPYETSGETVLPGAQLRTMLRERPAIGREFAPLLERCGVFGNKSAEALEPFYYWAMYEANRHATLTLGAIYMLPVGDRYQLLDAQYYVSGTYYTFVTLYDVWPMQLGDKTGALVWRGDFFAAPTLAYTRGVERLAYGAFMVQELKKTIRSFQNDAVNPSLQTAPKTAP